MENENKPTSELREDVQKLKRQISLLHIWNISILLLIFVWGVKYSKIVEALSLITERLGLLEKFVEMSCEINSALFDILKEFVCQIKSILA